MKHIKQHHPERADCGIACLAMVADVPYQVALEAMFECGITRLDGKLYTRPKHLVIAAGHLGIQCSSAKFSGWRPFVQLAIVKVNLDSENYWHWVVLSNDKQGPFVFDPGSDKVKIRDFRSFRHAGRCILVG